MAFRAGMKVVFDVDLLVAWMMKHSITWAQFQKMCNLGRPTLRRLQNGEKISYLIARKITFRMDVDPKLICTYYV